MNEMQNKLCEMLSWFHEFCQKNNLRYYIIAGTMLGAIRHGGFIPWDDDIDVGMPRSDYERLHKLFDLKKEGKYIFEFPDEKNNEYPFLWAKIYDTTTTLIEKQRHKIKRGIYIDIFPLDGIGNNLEESVINYKPLKKAVFINSIISFAFLKRRKLYQNCAVLIGRIISPLFVSKKRTVKKIDKLCKRYDFDSCKIVSNLLGGSHIKGMVPREYFGQPTLIKFEDITVYGLEKPEQYLSSMYGNYMQLPPIEKQISLHDSAYLDLSKGYLE